MSKWLSNMFWRCKDERYKRLYFTWQRIKQRCFNANNPDFKNYGGRGITMDSRWLDFELFVRDMGGSYKVGLSIGRKDNNGNYSRDNCRWENAIQQANNRRSSRKVFYLGKYKTLSDWAATFNKDYLTVSQRFYRGWSLDRCFNVPIDRRK